MTTRDTTDRDDLRELVRAPDDGMVDDLLHRLVQAVILVTEGGRVVRMNQRASEIVAQGDGLLIQHGVLRGVRPADTAALRRLIAEAVRREPCHGYAAGVGLRLDRPSRRWPLTALVTPLRPQGARSNGRAVAALFISDPEQAPTIDAQMLRDWYDLTPAEARVAALLAGGTSLDGIVERLGIAANTARTHLKNIFAKTDTRRQGELIRLLLSSPTLG